MADGHEQDSITRTYAHDWCSERHQPSRVVKNSRPLTTKLLLPREAHKLETKQTTPSTNILTSIMNNTQQQTTDSYSPLAVQDNNNNNSIHSTGSEYDVDYDDELTDRQLGGAAVAGGLAGLVLGGPILAVLAAAGTAVAATTKSKTGQVARSSGDAMASFGDRLKELDQKHHVIERTSKSIASGANYVTRQIHRDTRQSGSAANATV